ncbi:unnamed protein product [Ambrosiozyma monospora]|uniref:Unnamed protein product n=1 Tax=Ambrosiozyma monospora TaxID=43982 RepID=A0A9W6YQW7_AMBMO|nr:unnamed protein product [Ambrosiozyma monospora]
MGAWVQLPESRVISEQRVVTDNDGCIPDCGTAPKHNIDIPPYHYCYRSNTKSAAQVEKELKTEANKAADSLNDVVKDASHRVDDFKKDAKHKLDDLTAAAAKEVDDFKKSLPEREEEVKNFFQKIYHSVATTANNFYTSVRTTVEQNPVATSQVFLAAVIGTAAYYGNETGKFRVDFNDKKSKELTGAILAGIAALDTLAITLYNQKQSKKLI